MVRPIGRIFSDVLLAEWTTGINRIGLGRLPTETQYASDIYYDHIFLLTAVDDTHGDHRPLDKYRQQCIRQNLPCLIDLLNLKGGLLDSLYAEDFINTSQHNRINEQQTTAKKNELILDILRRKSVADFKKFIRCMKNQDNGPDHLVDYFGELGG